MAARKRSGTAVAAGRKHDILENRLSLIKKRHRELILRPREEMLQGLLEDEDPFTSLEETDELQFLGELEFQADF